MSDAEEYEKARALFRRFQGRDAKPGEVIGLEAAARVLTVLEVGTLVSLGYRATGNGETYYHEFEARRPKLFVSATGQQAFIIGGGYRFTDRGFLK
jgi:hypothetical protein